jgi:hypothetical protein
MGLDMGGVERDVKIWSCPIAVMASNSKDGAVGLPSAPAHEYVGVHPVSCWVMSAKPNAGVEDSPLQPAGGARFGALALDVRLKDKPFHITMKLVNNCVVESYVNDPDVGANAPAFAVKLIT